MVSRQSVNPYFLTALSPLPAGNPSVPALRRSSLPATYIEANGPDYRIWKRVPRDELRAIEVYQSYRFWVWFIEAFGTLTTTRFITWLMQKLV